MVVMENVTLRAGQAIKNRFAFSTSQVEEALEFGKRKTNQRLNREVTQMIKTDQRKVLFLQEEYADGQGKYTYSDGESYEREW